MDGARGVTCVGNNLMVWQDDNRTGAFSPSHGIVYQGLEDCVISNNVLYNGATRQLLVDLGGHGNGLVVKDNPGRLFKDPDLASPSWLAPIRPHPNSENSE